VEIGKLLSFYLRYKERRDELEAAFKKSVEPIDTRIEQIASELHKYLLDTGTKTVSTSEATAFLKKTAGIKVGNKAEFVDFIDEQYQKDGKEALYWLKISAAETIVNDYVDAHGEPPPGIDYQPRQTLVIRVKNQPKGESNE
jgi:predicted adenine nucleotide alpha hydrolase (AANH) superfamily ATPase